MLVNEEYEEAIASYDKALSIKPDDHQAWNNRGYALRQLGRYNKACVYALQSKIDLVIKNLEQAISLNEQYCEMAKDDSDFDNIRQDSRLQKLLQGDHRL